MSGYWGEEEGEEGIPKTPSMTLSTGFDIMFLRMRWRVGIN